MARDEFVIQTRQKADLLALTKIPLGAGGSFQSRIRRVEGYAEIELFGVSDQPFQIKVFEATDVRRDGTGNFVLTQAAIVATASGAQWVICTRIDPCGRFAYFVLENTGAAMTELAASVLGLPV